MPEIAATIAYLQEPANRALVSGMLRGIERETLRVTPSGQLAISNHPEQLGSALTHPQITTDFSESLLEFITSPSHQIDQVLTNLNSLHQFTQLHLGDEMLWASSMPCALGADEDIPVARFGSSNSGRMKTIYRLGLGQRYGRKMQTIAGLHYNFSVPTAFWAAMSAREHSSLSKQEYRTSRYFDMIRNFRRYYWLLLYLMGASPAVSSCFVDSKNHQLQAWDESATTLYRPFATSLRMGDLGYQSNAQKSLVVNYNDLKSYLKTLCTAINKPYSRYQDLGLHDASGQQQQLNTSLLQIENEFYSAIRPKRTANTGETALTALFNRGVEYIEVRCVDINPFEPLGLSRNQAMFLDTFLWHCILQPSPPSTEHEYRAIQENQARTVNDGRDPQLRLIQNGGEVKLRDWGRTLLATMAPVAEMLDATCGGVGYVQALEEQMQLMDNPELTPSGRILAAMREGNLSFHEFALALSKRNNEQIAKSARCESTMGHYHSMAKDSWQAQSQLEADQAKQSFEEFLQQYYQQYYFCSCPEFD